MQSIFSCKMFKNSPRQDQIKAALTDPINKELVIQLKEYLDEDYRQPEVAESTPSFEKENSSKGSDSDNESHIRKSPSSMSGATPPPHSNKPDHHLSEMLKDEESGSSEMEDTTPDSDDKPEEPASDKEPKDVEESTSLAGQAIQASEAPQGCSVVSTVDDIDAIVGLLNVVDETAGVRSAAIKNTNELWIYYKDSINLNNVMEPVISAFNAADYGYLNFNRLARTDNAIVFEIQMNPKKVDSIEDTKNAQ